MLVTVRHIAAHVLPYTAGPGLLFSTLAALLAAAGAGFRSELGTSYSDVLVAGLLLGGLWALLRQHPFLAGVLTGLAIGAKYTAAPFAVAALVALIVLHPKEWKAWVRWLLGVVLGWLVLGAWWAWNLATTYESPLFPFWNQFFGSPWYPEANLTDERYGAASLIDALLLPWRMTIGTAVVLDLPVRDPRWLIGLILVGLAAIVAVVAGRRISRPAAAVGAYIATGLALWLLVFGVLRYAIPAEMLMGVVIVAALGVITADDLRWMAAVSTSLLVVATVVTESAQARRVPFGDEWFRVGRDRLRRGRAG